LPVGAAFLNGRDVDGQQFRKSMTLLHNFPSIRLLLLPFTKTITALATTHAHIARVGVHEWTADNVQLALCNESGDTKPEFLLKAVSSTHTSALTNIHYTNIDSSSSLAGGVQPVDTLFALNVATSVVTNVNATLFTELTKLAHDKVAQMAEFYRSNEVALEVTHMRGSKKDTPKV
jgi:hypothetical protein